MKSCGRLVATSRVALQADLSTPTNRSRLHAAPAAFYYYPPLPTHPGKHPERRFGRALC